MQSQENSNLTTIEMKDLNELKELITSMDDNTIVEIEVEVVLNDE